MSLLEPVNGLKSFQDAVIDGFTRGFYLQNETVNEKHLEILTRSAIAATFGALNQFPDGKVVEIVRCFSKEIPVQTRQEAGVP
jgi:hypothetical protein